MTHTYQVTGMTCSGCENKVQTDLEKVENVATVKVSKEKNEAIIEMSKHVELSVLQDALGGNDSKYQITLPNTIVQDKPNKECCSTNKKEHNHHKSNHNHQAGTYYCPMQCEGDKVYGKDGDCPVCGMDLIQQPSGIQITQYTCPMHPQIIQDKPGSCPICGMDLVPLEPTASEEDKNYQALWHKMKIALVFSIPIFIITMSDMIPNNPLYKLMDLQYWNWVQFVFTIPVVFYACWMFFERAWKSIVNWNLNMFTLIGIGTGVAFLFSIVGLLFPDVFPAQFKTENGTVHLYFEATAVVLTLVLLGQLLEAKAHSRTSGAIKELLKLAPTEAT